MSNPFTATPFPASGGAYRVEGGHLVPDAPPTDEPGEVATEPAEQQPRRRTRNPPAEQE